ncbi:MAG TPA: hypothetical protein VJT49_06055 [Amycolatopsis sp.]|uniref:hypothetical protein n=1 Tax=Amycolatopsis sp. TaxID=37632 RepID=UPI002B47339D|nr:hypothetical protein [Amycolatopsis sp.]HKS44669.1 hypothetical protein [Amycolatopsis sp.]
MSPSHQATAVATDAGSVVSTVRLAVAVAFAGHRLCLVLVAVLVAHRRLADQRTGGRHVALDVALIKNKHGPKPSL